MKFGVLWWWWLWWPRTRVCERCDSDGRANSPCGSGGIDGDDVEWLRLGAGGWEKALGWGRNVGDTEGLPLPAMPMTVAGCDELRLELTHHSAVSVCIVACNGKDLLECMEFISGDSRRAHTTLEIHTLSSMP